MHPSVEQLLRVQAVDSEKNFLKKAMEVRPRELESEKKKLVAAQSAVEAIQAEIRDGRMAADKGELEIKNFDAEIEKHSIALNGAKTNQEYRVLTDQIDRAKEERGEVEERVLEELSRIDQLEERRGEAEQALAAEEKTFERKQAEVGEIVGSLAAKLQALDARRSELTREVNEDHLGIYERVLARRGDAAISVVRDFICQGCYMTVTSQNVTVLMQGAEIVQCKTCGRLLYLD